MFSDKNIRIASVLLLVFASSALFIATGFRAKAALVCIPVATSRGALTTAAVNK